MDIVCSRTTKKNNDDDAAVIRIAVGFDVAAAASRLPKVAVTRAPTAIEADDDVAVDDVAVVDDELPRMKTTLRWRRHLQ